jgi:hypothetical protein
MKYLFNMVKVTFIKKQYLELRFKGRSAESSPGKKYKLDNKVTYDRKKNPG